MVLDAIAAVVLGVLGAIAFGVEEKPSTDFGASLGCALTFAGAARGRRRDENEVRARATALNWLKRKRWSAPRSSG